MQYDHINHVWHKRCSGFCVLWSCSETAGTSILCCAWSHVGKLCLYHYTRSRTSQVDLTFPYTLKPSLNLQLGSWAFLDLLAEHGIKAKSLMFQRHHRLSGSLNFLLCFISSFLSSFCLLAFAPQYLLFQGIFTLYLNIHPHVQNRFSLLFVSVKLMLRHFGLLNGRSSLSEYFCDVFEWVQVK